MVGTFVRRALNLALIALLCVLGNLPEAAARGRRGRGRSSAQAAAARRQKTIQEAQAQIAAAQMVLSAAEYKGAGAQGKLQEAMGKLQHAASETERARETEQSLLADLLETEREILSEQSVDTEYYRVHEELNAAKKELAAAKEEVLTPDVVSELETLKGAARVQATNDRLELSPRYLLAHARVTTAGKELERIKSALFHADEDWKGTNQALADVRHDISVARGEAKTSGFSRLKPLSEYREASQAAAAARAAIAQAEGVLKSLNATASSSSSSKKKK